MTLHDEIERAARPLRRAVGWRVLLPAVLAGMALLVAAAWISTTGFFGVAAALVLAGWLALVAGLVLGAMRARRARARLDTAAVADALEALGPTRRGALTTLLAPAARGSSNELHFAAVEHQADWVAERGAAVLEGSIVAERSRTRRHAALLAMALGGLLLARPLGGAPAMVLKPWLAWQAMVEPVRLSVSAEQVAQGESVELEITALGQTSARLQMRRPGESWREQVVALDPSGHAAVETGPLDGDLVARAVAGGRTSREVRVSIRLPVFLGSFTLTARYPEYLGLESESLPTDADTLVIPEGTRLRLQGRATTPLAAAEWTSGRG
ncbi:MAG TPA: hypothetical protein PLL69_11205, partial [Gemmatimonadales bacterium]|nr:hypothetical protein [Gemmatimonadales bacterium]